MSVVVVKLATKSKSELGVKFKLATKNKSELVVKLATQNKSVLMWVVKPVVKSATKNKSVLVGAELKKSIFSKVQPRTKEKLLVCLSVG